MSLVLRSIATLGLLGLIASPVLAESKSETTPSSETAIAQQPVIQQDQPDQEKPGLLSQTDAPKPVTQPVTQKVVTRVPLSSRLFAVPSMQQ